jgi:hypothetical protein
MVDVRVMTHAPDIAAAVAEAYRMFSDNGLGGPLLVCTCGVCMSDEMKAEIEKTPRERLTHEQISEYLNSAHEASAPASQQMRWLLPRLLECCAEGPWPYWNTEYTFRKLNEAGLADWPEAERLVVRRVFLGLLSASVAGPAAENEPGALIEAFIRAGEPVGPYIELWDAERSESASVALAELINRQLTWARGERHLRLSQSWSSKDDSRQFIAWLLRPETVIRLQEAFFSASSAAKAEVLSLAHDVIAAPGH